MSQPFTPPGVLADLQTFAAASLTDDATLSRTGAALKCRVNADTREIHLQNIPRVLVPHFFRLSLPLLADIRPGDTLTVAGKGTYVVIYDATPVTNQTMTIAFTVYSAGVGGLGTLLPVNQTVTFRRQGTQELTAPVSVLILPVSPMEVVQGGQWSFTHQVIWSGTVTYPSDSTEPQQQDQIIWTGLRNKYATLSYPQRYTDPAVYTIAYFRDV